MAFKDVSLQDMSLCQWGGERRYTVTLKGMSTNYGINPSLHKRQWLAASVARTNLHKLLVPHTAAVTCQWVEYIGAGLPVARVHLILPHSLQIFLRLKSQQLIN